MPLILLLLILLPMVEITLLIEVGSRIGAAWTLLAIISTAALGLYLVRQQGLKVAADMRDALVRGQPPIGPMAEGFFLLVAGISLLVPGFLTDLVGGLLLIPPLRLYLARAGVARMILGNPKPGVGVDREGHMIVEGQYSVVEEADELAESDDGDDADAADR